MAAKILIVDDDAEIRSELRDFLQGYDILEAPGGSEALQILKRANEIDAVLLDVMMPGLDGIDVLKQIKKIDPQLSVIIFTGHSSKDTAVEALKGHADDYLEKPLDVGKMDEVIRRAIEARQGKNKCGPDTASVEGKIEKVKQFTQRNCFKKTTLEDAAAAVCVSPKYLSRLFKERAGISFTEYRLKIKMEQARQLLCKSGCNINQVSDKLGYENTESFIRQFKKFTRCTPAVFRLKSKKKAIKRKAAR